MRDRKALLTTLERLHRSAVEVYDKANAVGNDEIASHASLDVIGLSEAIEMVRHLVPTPPIMKKGRWYPFATCPECNQAFPTGEKPNYCQNCGKAVLWK